WRAAVAAANPNSLAALLYNTFAPNLIGTPGVSLNDYVANFTGFSDSFTDYLCPDNYGASTPAQMAQATAAAQRLARVIGVLPGETAGCSVAIPVQPGTFDRNSPFLFDTISVFKQQDNTPLGNLFNGHEGSLRLDYNWNDRNRFFTQMNWTRANDTFGPGLPDSARGFFNPVKNTFPNFQFNYVRTFSPHVINEFKAGYAGNITLTRTNLPGVPQVNFDDGTMGFGSYSGYPQFFKENIYTYSDIVSVNKGSHNMKIGGEFRRNHPADHVILQVYAHALGGGGILPAEIARRIFFDGQPLIDLPQIIIDLIHEPAVPLARRDGRDGGLGLLLRREGDEAVHAHHRLRFEDFPRREPRRFAWRRGRQAGFFRIRIDETN